MNAHVLLGLAILPWLQYLLGQQVLNKAEDYWQLARIENQIYPNLAKQFLQKESNQRLGFRSARVTMFQLKNGLIDTDVFADSIQRNLEIEIPCEFKKWLEQKSETTGGGVRPTNWEFPLMDEEKKFFFENNSLSFVIQPTKAASFGELRCWEDNQLKWSQSIWTASLSGFGPNDPDTLSIELVFSDDYDSVFVFSVHTDAFCIAEFNTNTGERLECINSLLVKKQSK